MVELGGSLPRMPLWLKPYEWMSVNLKWGQDMCSNHIHGLELMDDDLALKHFLPWLTGCGCQQAGGPDVPPLQLYFLFAETFCMQKGLNRGISFVDVHDEPKRQ